MFVSEIVLGATIKADADPRKEAKELAQWVERNVENVYTSVFDKRGDYKKLRASGTGRQLAARSSQQDVPMRSAARRAEIIEIYSQAWKHRYNNLRTRARNAGLGSSPDYQSRKKQPGTYFGRLKRYSSPLLLTGHLREAVFSGIKQGGNEFVDLPNMLLFGTMAIDFDAFDRHNDGRSYASGLVGQLINRGVIESEVDFYDFADFYWDRIITLMKRVIRQDFAPALGDALDYEDF